MSMNQASLTGRASVVLFAILFLILTSSLMVHFSQAQTIMIPGTAAYLAGGTAPAAIRPISRTEVSVEFNRTSVQPTVTGLTPSSRVVAPKVLTLQSYSFQLQPTVQDHGSGGFPQILFFLPLLLGVGVSVLLVGWRRHRGRARLAVLLLAIILGSVGGPSAYAVSSTQLTVTLTEWPIFAFPVTTRTLSPNSPGPEGVFADNLGNLFFAVYGGIGKLTLSTNTMTIWALPAADLTHSPPPPGRVWVTSTGEVYFTEVSANQIGRLVPSTNVVTEWLRFTGTQTLDLFVDGSGNVFYTDPDKGYVGRLVPATNVMTEWKMPCSSCDAETTGISVDSSGNVFVGDALGNGISRLAPATNVLTNWIIPTSNALKPGFGTSQVFVAPSQDVYFTEDNGNKIGLLSPSTNVITEWPILTANSGSQAIAVDSSGNIFFTETSAMKIGRFVPSTNIMTEWSVANLDGGIVSSIFVDASNNVFFNEYVAGQIGRLS